MPYRRLALLGALVLSCQLNAQLFDPATRSLARDIFQQLIEINTTDSVGSTTVAAQAMAKRLLDAGFPASDVTVLGPNDRKGNLVVRLRGTGAAKPILIIGHLDVVEARREDWTTDPFQFVEKDGFFYGRGTQDMKVNDAILMVTLIRFRREGYHPDRDIILALTADEEGGSFNGVDWLLKNHRNLVEAGFVLNADAGGILSEKGKPIDMEVEATEKLYADFQLTVKNPGGHSSLPVPDNAIYHIPDALARLERSPFPFELNPVTRAYFEQLAKVESKETAADMKGILRTPPNPDALRRLSQDPHYNATVRTTCVATRLEAGHANNALAQTAQANVNCRIFPGHSPEEIRQVLMGVFADDKLTVKYVSDDGAVSDSAPERKAMVPPAPIKEVFDPLTRFTQALWPGTPVTPVMENGASDSIYFAQAGIPCYGYSAIALERDDDRAHGQDERLPVDSYWKSLDFFYGFAKSLGGE